MRPLEIACRLCAQQANEVCIDQYRIPLSYYHAQRISDAVLADSDSSEAVSREEFDRAVDDSGLV